MIRLARAEFVTGVPRGPELSPARVTEMTREQGFDIKADMTTRTVHLGDDIYPFERVVRMRRAPAEHECPECGEDKFDSASALGAHRKHKHGVKGTWRKTDAAESPDALAGSFTEPDDEVTK